MVTPCSGLDLKGPRVKCLVPSVALWGGCDTFRKKGARRRLLDAFHGVVEPQPFPPLAAWLPDIKSLLQLTFSL